MSEQAEPIALPSPPPKDVGAAVAWVMSQVGYVQKTTSGNLNYSFASESALIAALRPPMVAAGLVLHVAQLLELRQDTFETKNKAVMNRATVLGIVRLTHTPSATTLDVAACGEGMDVGDKSVNKAMTGMLKYALRQTFLIETGDDPDGSHPEVTGRKQARSEGRPRPATPPPAHSKPAPAANVSPAPATNGTKAKSAQVLFWDAVRDQGLSLDEGKRALAECSGDFEEALRRMTKAG